LLVAPDRSGAGDDVQPFGCFRQTVEEVVMTDEQSGVEREVTLPVDRQEAWRALTEAELLEQWLAEEVDVDLREGGEAVFRYRDREERRATVQRVVEPERLSLRWRRAGGVESEVDFRLEDAVGGTRVVVVERAAGRGPLAAAGAWEEGLFALGVLSLVRLGASRPSRARPGPRMAVLAG
jgi:uncharacterized protein YndB with AHSA1/START domain